MAVESRSSVHAWPTPAPADAMDVSRAAVNVHETGTINEHENWQ
jgi:hypothetical protein